MAPYPKVVEKKSLGGSFKFNDYAKRRLKLKNEYLEALHKIDVQELEELHKQRKEMTKGMQELETQHMDSRDDDENKENVAPTNALGEFYVMPAQQSTDDSIDTDEDDTETSYTPIVHDTMKTSREEEEEEEDDDDEEEQQPYDKDAVVKLVTNVTATLDDTRYRRILRQQTVKYFDICNEYGLNAKSVRVFKRVIHAPPDDISKYGQAHRACKIDMSNDWTTHVLTGINKIANLR